MNAAEAGIILVLILVVVGPERLPEYASQLARIVRELRKMAMGAKEQVRAELGPEFDDVDWKKLDPRQYDPRKIVRDALTEVWEEEPTPPPAAAAAKEKTAAAQVNFDKRRRQADGDGSDAPFRAPFDAEAT